MAKRHIDNDNYCCDIEGFTLEDYDYVMLRKSKKEKIISGICSLGKLLIVLFIIGIIALLG